MSTQRKNSLSGIKNLMFPGDPSDPVNPRPSRQILLTNKILGKGQFGTVHYAFNKADPKDEFAVKCIERKRIRSDKEMQNLQNEIAIMAEIDSPYVISLKDATKTPNNFYLALELCNGGDLENFRKLRGGYLLENEARILIW